MQKNPFELMIQVDNELQETAESQLGLTSAIEREYSGRQTFTLSNSTGQIILGREAWEQLVRYVKASS